MFPVSPAFQEIMASRTGRQIDWLGTITLTNGRIINFTMDNVAEGSGQIINACDLPFIGGAYSAELQMQVFLTIDARLLKNAVISLTARMVRTAIIETWGDARSYLWSDIASTQWGNTSQTVHADIPMGLFQVMTAKREIDSIKLEAYDYMTKFDTPLPEMDTTARTPFEWLRWTCKACSVELGIRNDQIKSFVNGNRSFNYADIGNDVKTYRDLISQLAVVVGAIAIINRYGALTLIKLDSTSVATITPDDRFSSDYADYQSYYTGLRAQYKAGAINEYYRNVLVTNDDGLIIDLGTNVFLQIANDGNRSVVAKAIIDQFKNVRFTPYEASIPFNPAYDLLDVLTFTGGHAPANTFGPVTSISRSFGGAMTVKCATPSEQDNPVRETTKADGISGGGVSGASDDGSGYGGSFYGSTEFWIKIAIFPKEAVTITDETVTTEISVDCTVPHTTMQIAWTGAYNLSEATTVTAQVLVDNEVIYKISEDQTAGNHILNVTTGHSVKGEGTHKVKVILSEGDESNENNGIYIEPEEPGSGDDSGSGSGTGGNDSGGGSDSGNSGSGSDSGNSGSGSEGGGSNVEPEDPIIEGPVEDQDPFEIGG